MGCSGNGRSDRRRDSRRWDSRLRCGHWKTTVDWVANAEAASPCGPAFRPHVSPRAKGGPSPGRLPNHGTAPFGTRESPRAKRFFRFVYHYGQNCPSWEKPFGILPGRFFHTSFESPRMRLFTGFPVHKSKKSLGPRRFGCRRTSPKTGGEANRKTAVAAAAAGTGTVTAQGRGQHPASSRAHRLQRSRLRRNTGLLYAALRPTRPVCPHALNLLHPRGLTDLAPKALRNREAVPGRPARRACCEPP